RPPPTASSGTRSKSSPRSRSSLRKYWQPDGSDQAARKAREGLLQGVAAPEPAPGDLARVPRRLRRQDAGRLARPAARRHQVPAADALGVREDRGQEAAAAAGGEPRLRDPPPEELDLRPRRAAFLGDAARGADGAGPVDLPDPLAQLRAAGAAHARDHEAPGEDAEVHRLLAHPPADPGEAVRGDRARDDHAPARLLQPA